MQNLSTRNHLGEILRLSKGLQSILLFHRAVFLHCVLSLALTLALGRSTTVLLQSPAHSGKRKLLRVQRRGTQFVEETLSLYKLPHRHLVEGKKAHMVVQVSVQVIAQYSLSV